MWDGSFLWLCILYEWQSRGFEIFDGKDREGARQRHVGDRVLAHEKTVVEIHYSLLEQDREGYGEED